MALTKYSNKCCLKSSNEITIIKNWSYFCKKCGRYNYDQNGWSITLKDSMEELKNFLSIKENRKFIKQLKKIKNKKIQNIIRKYD